MNSESKFNQTVNYNSYIMDGLFKETLISIRTSKVTAKNRLTSVVFVYMNKEIILISIKKYFIFTFRIEEIVEFHVA